MKTKFMWQMDGKEASLTHTIPDCQAYGSNWLKRMNSNLTKSFVTVGWQRDKKKNETVLKIWKDSENSQIPGVSRALFLTFMKFKALFWDWEERQNENEAKLMKWVGVKMPREGYGAHLKILPPGDFLRKQKNPNTIFQENRGFPTLDLEKNKNPITVVYINIWQVYRCTDYYMLCLRLPFAFWPCFLFPIFIYMFLNLMLLNLF